MKAALLRGPNDLTVTDVHDPEIGEYEVLCELLFAATCTGTDSHIIDGSFPFANPYPTIPGHESIGRVVEKGAKVRHFQLDDLVTRVGAPSSRTGEYTSSWGGYATMGVAVDYWAMLADGLPLPDDDFQIRTRQSLPADIDPTAAPMIITWRETLSYVTRMGVGAGASVLIIGSGGNGLAMANHAANLGASRVGMIGNAIIADRAAAVGVGHFGDYRGDDPAGEMKALSGGEFDFAVDAVGKAGNLDIALSLLKSDGCLGLYGLDEIGKCLIGAPGRPFRFFPSSYDEEESHGAVINFMRCGRLRATDYLWNIDSPYPLDKINTAFADLAARRAGPKSLIRLAGQ